MKKQITLLFALLFSFAANLLAQKETRQQLNFDFDWTFSLTDSERYITKPFVKGECVEVQLPHDWNIRQEFDKKWGGAVAYLPEWLLAGIRKVLVCLPVVEVSRCASYSMVFLCRAMFTLTVTIWGIVLMAFVALSMT